MKKRIQTLLLADLADLVSRQVNTFIPDCSPVSAQCLQEAIADAIERTFFCFSAIKLPYYSTGKEVIFNHLNSDHYCTFLYFVMNNIYKKENREDLATKIFLLNKYLHGLDLFYRIELPDIFLFVHPLGTIIGRAEYKNYTIFYQNVSIGALPDLLYPKFGEKIIFYAKSSIIGNAHVGDNVIFSANSFLLNKDVPSDTVVVGSHPNCKIHKNNTSIIENIFSLENECSTG